MRLPDRRAVERFEFGFSGQLYTACLGRFNDGGIAEIFLSGNRRSGSMVEGMARDEAVLLSLALQYGCPVDVILAALGRRELVIDGKLVDVEWASPIGAAVAAAVELGQLGPPPASAAVPVETPGEASQQSQQ
jgi:hypothetical protein